MTKIVVKHRIDKRSSITFTNPVEYQFKENEFHPEQGECLMVWMTGDIIDEPIWFSLAEWEYKITEQ